MPKNIVIFADGTGQAGGQRPDQSLSNIYKLFRAARVGPDNRIDPSEQVAFYDPGLGTEEDGGAIPLRALKWYRKSISGATGTGIGKNIADCYEAILKHYEPGDRVFLLGFSRGAYTARCVGGVMGLCGIPTRGKDGAPLPRFGRALRAIADEAVSSVYEHGSGKEAQRYKDERNEKARRFRETYASAQADGTSNEVPYFIGVFDTVAALGSAGIARIGILLMHALLLLGLAALVALSLSTLFDLGFGASFTIVAVLVFLAAAGIWLKSNLKVIRDFPAPGKPKWHFARWRLKFYNTELNKRVRFARHALAIDEERENFARVPWSVDGALVTYAEGPEWMKQVWFAGNHSDIGGSYPEDEARLSDIALKWMVEEAKALPHPLVIDDSKLHLFPSATGMQHSEVRALWEKYPGWWPERIRKSWPIQRRPVEPRAVLHPTVFERLRANRVSLYGTSGPYRPPELQAHEIAKEHWKT